MLFYNHNKTFRPFLFAIRLAHRVTRSLLSHLNSVLNSLVQLLPLKQVTQSRGMRIAEWKMSPRATFQNAPPSLFSEDTSSGLFKDVDDTEVYKVVENKRTSHAQFILNEVSAWSTKNMLQLHSRKCNELKITFARSPKNHELVEIDGCEFIQYR